jgi:hypothetical protein
MREAQMKEKRGCKSPGMGIGMMKGMMEGMGSMPPMMEK